ncbi:MAG: amidohydrolase [Chloroflexi bacterium]|nr:amidohydrolase [Chloroflexota bacterium]
MTTILLKNGYLLDPSRELARADILIEGDTIIQVGAETRREADRVMDLKGKIVMPGLISAHSHTTTLLQRGMADNLPLEHWRLYMILVEDERSSRDVSFTPSDRDGVKDVYVLSALAAAEFLLTGTTGLVDTLNINWRQFDSQMDAVMQAYVDVGIRAVAAPSYSDMTFSQTMPVHLLEVAAEASILDAGPPPDPGEIAKTLDSYLRRWTGRHTLITPGLAPTGTHRCSGEMMEQTVELARKYDAPIQTHLLETKLQAVVSRKKFGGSTGEFLRRVGCVGPNTSFAHGVWVDDVDIAILAETGSSIVHNPLSNMRIGSGIAPVQRMRARGLNVALGADGAGSADNHNMIEVMKFAALLGKLYGPRESWISALDAWDMCVTGGARVMRQKVGQTAPGYLADLVVLNDEALFMMPKESLVAQMAYSELGSSVDTVLVGGRVVVERGEVLTVDVSALHAEAQEIVSRMYRRIHAGHERFAAARGVLDRMADAVSKEKLAFSRYADL